MFGISGAEVVIILLVALVVLGPDRLPQVARKAGQVMGEMRKVSAGFEAEMRTAMYEQDRPTHRPTPDRSDDDHDVETPRDTPASEPPASIAPTAGAGTEPARSETGDAGPADPVGRAEEPPAPIDRPRRSWPKPYEGPSGAAPALPPLPEGFVDHEGWRSHHPDERP